MILHIKKGKQAYRMITQWHLQKPDLDLGNLTSVDGHLVHKIDQNLSDLSLLRFTITNDLTGVPKLPDNKIILGKVYSLNAPTAKELPEGIVNIEMAENPPDRSKIARFDEGKNSWVEYDTKIENNMLTAQVDGGGILAVLTTKK